MTILSPSSVSRRIACPGSFQLESQNSVASYSTAAEEGIEAHRIAAEILKNLNTSYKYAKDLNKLLKMCNKNFRLLTDLSLYINDVIKTLKQENLSPHLLNIEKKLQIHNIHAQCEGTPDCYVYSPIQDTLFVWDLKYGHYPISAFENYQLLEYAAGIIHTENFINFKPTTRIILSIIQPRDYNSKIGIDRWGVTFEQLKDKYFPYLKKIEKLAVSENPKTSAGPHCNFCKAKTSCLTLKNSAAFISDIAKHDPNKIMHNDSVGRELQNLKKIQKILEARRMALEEIAVNNLKRGIAVENYTLKSKLSNRKWAYGIEEVLNLGRQFNVDLLKSPELITPAQAKNLGIPDKTVDKFSTRTQSSLKLTEVKDNFLQQLFNQS